MKHREPVTRQLKQSLLFDRLELLTHLLLRRSVNPRVGDRPFPVKQVLVLLRETLERVALQSVVLRVLDAALDLALVLRGVRLRRKKRRAVVSGKGLQLRMHFRVVPVGPVHRRFQIVDDERLRNAAEVMQRVLGRRDEVVRDCPLCRGETWNRARLANAV